MNAINDSCMFGDWVKILSLKEIVMLSHKQLLWEPLLVSSTKLGLLLCPVLVHGWTCLTIVARLGGDGSHRCTQCILAFKKEKICP